MRPLKFDDGNIIHDPGTGVRYGGYVTACQYFWGISDVYPLKPIYRNTVTTCVRCLCSQPWNPKTARFAPP